MSTTVVQKALKGQTLTLEEGKTLYRLPLTTLMQTAHTLRLQKTPKNLVTWQIDRNVNITNVCQCRCKFCNFHTTLKNKRAYITPLENYKQKIDELISLHGDQLLIQGGMHPDLGLDFYTDLFMQLKAYAPNIKLHALGPPEVVFLANKEGLTYEQTLDELVTAGMDSLPGAGAEILDDRVRKIVSPAKATTDQWLEVMRIAHKKHMLTSATMMFGHVETIDERLKHLIHIRELQAEKPKEAPGFKAFIPWPFQPKNTLLQKRYDIQSPANAMEYVRMIAISRIMLPNIDNIQASWLTVGKEVGQLCLFAGANDLGSIMIEEHVVSQAGATHTLNANGMLDLIQSAGFTPQLRDQHYHYREL
ncbi:MAG: cyclic dehypoxanthinyl futalosine synthase [Bacteroidota bacterium]